jgi:DNA repair photolyase
MPHYFSSPKRAVLRGDLPDTFCRALYRVAPYKGCAHACRYCDGRAEKYHVEGDFGCDIEVRRTVPELFEHELPDLREPGLIAFGSGVTDPYQPCERVHNLTGACASTIASFNTTQRQNTIADSTIRAYPALVMTKSSLVNRDIEIWKSVQRTSGFVLLISLTSTDESVRIQMEPGASLFQERIDTLRQFKEAGCFTGVLAMPLLPGISDSRESIGQLYDICTQVKVDFLMPGGLTLRPGRQKDGYLNSIRDHYPQLYASTKAAFSEDRPSGIPRAENRHELQQRIDSVRKAFCIPWLLPYKVYSMFLPRYDCLHLLLHDMIELYSDRRVDTSALCQATERFDIWLLEVRRYFRRHRKLPYEWLEERFQSALTCGELENVISNKKLFSLIESVFLANTVFDYSTLKLVSRETSQ